MFRRREQGEFFIPLAVITIFCGVVFYLNSGALHPMFDAEFDRQMSVAMRQNPNIPPEAIERMPVAVVGRMDLITIWITVLVAIGLCVTGRIPMRKAAIAAAIVWVVGGLVSIFGALRAM